MQRLIHKKSVLALSAFLFAIVISTIGFIHYVYATSEAVTLAGIDYANMELSLNTDNNTIIYYSTNKTKWIEADAAIDSSTKTMSYDISWLSATGNTTLYFRGNVNKTTLPVTIPGYNKSFKVKFDKASGQFEFSNTDGIEVIRWRKSTDYTWNYIWADRGKTTIENTIGDATCTKYGVEGKLQSLEDFEAEVDAFRVKGVKLVFQTAPKAWTTNDEGARPSKDVNVSVTAKRAAPSVKVNIKKITVNTKTTMEYTTSNPFTGSATWTKCTQANMALSDLAPDAVNGTSEVVLYFRSQATSTNCESKIAALTIPKREEASTVTVALSQTAGTAPGKSKATLMFSNVPSTGCEYYVSKTGSSIDETKITWKKITKAKNVSFTEKTLPAGAIIYVRESGVALNATKGIDLKLPSKYTTITVGAYTTTSSDTGTTS